MCYVRITCCGPAQVLKLPISEPTLIFQLRALPFAITPILPCATRKSKLPHIYPNRVYIYEIVVTYCLRNLLRCLLSFWSLAQRSLALDVFSPPLLVRQ